MNRSYASAAGNRASLPGFVPAKIPASFSSSLQSSDMTSSMPTPMESMAMKKENWPADFKAYVTRSYQMVSNLEQRQKLEFALKQMMLEAIRRLGGLDRVSWSLRPLPNIEIPVTGIQETTVTPSSSKKRKTFDVAPTTADDADRLAKEARARRFASDHLLHKKPQPPSTLVSVPSKDVIDWDEHTIVGTSTAIEKPYLRLTSAPDPSTVRPLPVLKKTLEFLKTKWIKENDYSYICDQFKSLRQDLTVQRIKNDFTVVVYEIHARIALEKGDLGEFNQCQTQLAHLYSLGLSGSETEFIAYRILYWLHTKNRTAMVTLLGALSIEQKTHPNIAHSLHVRKALAHDDYYALFQLYLEAPAMAPYIMDHFIPRARLCALSTICKAYRPTVPLLWLAETLAFESMRALIVWLKTIISSDAFLQVNLMHQRGELDCKVAAPMAQAAAASPSSSVDIKGQI